MEQEIQAGGQEQSSRDKQERMGFGTGFALGTWLLDDAGDCFEDVTLVSTVFTHKPYTTPSHPQGNLTLICHHPRDVLLQHLATRY